MLFLVAVLNIGLTLWLGIFVSSLYSSQYASYLYFLLYRGFGSGIAPYILFASTIAIGITSFWFAQSSGDRFWFYRLAKSLSLLTFVPLVCFLMSLCVIVVPDLFSEAMYQFAYIVTIVLQISSLVVSYRLISLWTDPDGSGTAAIAVLLGATILARFPTLLDLHFVILDRLLFGGKAYPNG